MRSYCNGPCKFRHSGGGRGGGFKTEDFLTSLELVSGIIFSHTLNGIAVGDIDFCHNFTNHHLPLVMTATSLSVCYVDG